MVDGQRRDPEMNIFSIVLQVEDFMVRAYHEEEALEPWQYMAHTLRNLRR